MPTQTQFHTPLNNAVSTLTTPHVIGDGVLVLANAAGFGTPTPTTPVRVSAKTSSTTYAIFSVTGVTGNTLTIGGLLEGTSDINIPSGTTIEDDFTAGHLTDAYDAIHTIEANYVTTASTYSDPSWLTSLSAAKLTGTLPVLHGGTGQTTTVAALNALLPTQTGNSGKVLTTDGSGVVSWVTVSAGSNGTVTSVGLTMPSGLTVSGSPVTGNGTLAVTTTLTGIIKGNGSGFAVASAGTDYLAPSGSGAALTGITGSQVSGNIAGNAANVTGVVAIANGGTGGNTAVAALNALLPTQSGNSGKFLSTDGSGNVSWGVVVLSGQTRMDSHYGSITADTDAATVTFDCAVSDKHTLTLGGNRTLAVTNDQVGQTFLVILKQDATGSRTITNWWSGILWPNGVIPTLTTTPLKRDIFTFIKTATGEYLGFVSGLNL